MVETYHLLERQSSYRDVSQHHISGHVLQASIPHEESDTVTLGDHRRGLQGFRPSLVSDYPFAEPEYWLEEALLKKKSTCGLSKRSIRSVSIFKP